MLYALVIYLCSSDGCNLNKNDGVEFIGRLVSRFECQGSAIQKLNNLRNAPNNGMWRGECISETTLSKINLKGI